MAKKQKAKKKARKKAGRAKRNAKGKNYRSAVSGRFISPECAEKSPRTSVGEKRK